MATNNEEIEATYVENTWGEYKYDPKLSFEDNVQQARLQEAVITLEKLRNIEAGITTVEKQEGPEGKPGPKGDLPKHKWEGTTQVRFENPDGTWGTPVDLNPTTAKIHQEVYIASAGQEIFDLKLGVIRLGKNSVRWYLDGLKQSNDGIEELDSNRIKIVGGVPEGSTVIIEYIEYMNITSNPAFTVATEEDIDTIF